jgi:hypothetical protein
MLGAAGGAMFGEGTLGFYASKNMVQKVCMSEPWVDWGYQYVLCQWVPHGPCNTGEVAVNAAARIADPAPSSSAAEMRCACDCSQCSAWVPLVVALRGAT